MDKISYLTRLIDDGELVLLASRPCVGKTTFALYLANAFSTMNKKVVYFSLVQEKKLIEVMLSHIKPSSFNNNIIIDDALEISIKQICEKISSHGKVDVVVIDELWYLYHLTTNNHSNDNITLINSELKNLAIKLNVSIVCLSTIPRWVDYRKNNRPLLKDVAMLEQDFDTIIFLHRDDHYDYDKVKARQYIVELDVLIEKSNYSKLRNIKLECEKKGKFLFIKDFINADFDKIFSNRYNEQLIDYGIIYGTGKTVFLIKTGQNGSVYGYNNKYLKMAKHINLQYGCTVVVSSNPYDCTDSLGQALEVIKQEVNQDVDVYYMGMSNGAILGARFGHLHSEIKRMLLINGPLMINWSQTKKGLEKFEGESVVMVYGSLDPSFKYAEMIEFIDNPGKIRLITIEGADHNFKNMDECFQSLLEEYLFY